MNAIITNATGLAPLAVKSVTSFPAIVSMIREWLRPSLRVNLLETGGLSLYDNWLKTRSESMTLIHRHFAQGFAVTDEFYTCQENKFKRK